MVWDTIGTPRYAESMWMRSEGPEIPGTGFAGPVESLEGAQKPGTARPWPPARTEDWPCVPSCGPSPPGSHPASSRRPPLPAQAHRLAGMARRSTGRWPSASSVWHAESPAAAGSPVPGARPEAPAPHPARRCWCLADREVHQQAVGDSPSEYSPETPAELPVPAPCAAGAPRNPSC